ncbi:hypothetical protein Airi02_071990 [Actinoallomurus iriomotensis]|uniref:Uncharacterized protein n=1 Tax=Actinoallomurus iriomotensis TaxID=478107 RepID=A0A9W6W2T5_9ACTN|nr:hypothetical protein Airi02_071990 [Actinoallomurus iriomotensis]
MARAPSKPTFSPPKVSRQSCNQPVVRMGECGARSAIWSGSMLEAYAAYKATVAQRTAWATVAAR